MKRKAYRITQRQHAAASFNGEGARLHGGRWNSIGTRMVYTADSISLALLEILVHLEDFARVNARYTIVPIEFDESLLETLNANALPPGWNAPQPSAITQTLGDRWIARMTSPILEVPSVIVEMERNYLLNPAHPDFAKIAIGNGFTFQTDARLFK